MFAQGGVIAAILAPVHILVQGVLGPLGIVPAVNLHYRGYADALANPLVKLYLLVLIAFTFFHCAHRFPTVVHHAGVNSGILWIARLSYAAAVLGSLITAYVLLNVP
jgi:fumarate reductase subunit D